MELIAYNSLPLESVVCRWRKPDVLNVERLLGGKIINLLRELLEQWRWRSDRDLLSRSRASRGPLFTPNFIHGSLTEPDLFE